MYRTFQHYRSPTASSGALTLALVKSAWNSRFAVGDGDFNFVVPRFKIAPSVGAYTPIITSSTMTQYAIDNYANCNWGRCPCIVPNSSALIFHYAFPRLSIATREDNCIEFLVPDSGNYALAFVQYNVSGINYCSRRYIFAYDSNGPISGYACDGEYGPFASRYFGSQSYIGFCYVHDSTLKFGCFQSTGDASSGKQVSVRTESFGDTFTRAFLNLFNVSTADELAPSDVDMNCVVSIDGDTTFQLFADTNFKETSGRAKFSNMSQIGIIRGKKVTIDYSKLDPYYLNTAAFYTAYNRSIGNWGSGYDAIFTYANGWESYVPNYVKRLISAGFGGTVAPGGGANSTPFNALLDESGNKLSELSALSTIPNPATTAVNARRYNNVALTAPSAPDTYFGGDTEGAIAVENSDPKYINFYLSAECKRSDDTSTATHLPLWSVVIPCNGGASYWQSTPLLCNNISLYIDKQSGKAVLFQYRTPEVYNGSIYVSLSQYNTSVSLQSWLMEDFARLVDYNDTLARLYGGSPDNPSDPTDTPDPNDYNPNGPTVPEMNPGSFDDTSDKIPLPDKPTISVVDAGLITLFNPTLSQLQALSKYMWSDMTTTSGWFDTAKKIFADPMQYFIALNILPFNVPEGSTVSVKLAGFNTGVSITKAANQFVDIDCGSYALNEYWGSALDYAPSTKIWCFLPFVGSVPLDPDMVMKSTIRIVYRTDILTGAFVAFILANDNVLYHFNGNMATNVPLTGADYSRLVSAIIGAASTVALTAGAAGAAGQAAMGVGAARTGLQAASAGMNQAISTVQAHAPSFGASMMRGGSTGIAGDMFQMLQTNADELTQAGRNMGKATAARNAAGGVLAASGVHAVHNTVNAVMAAKPSIAISGQMSGCSGLMDIQYPYLIIQRPNQALPENYKHYVGYPSHMLADVQSCRGYTVFEQIELSGIPCTDDELAEINDILKGGFYG